MARTDIYGKWELCPVEIPKRTRLFSLEPAGIGTPEVESLSGYIARLAQAHVVSVGNLLGRGLTGGDRRKSCVASPILAETIRSRGHGFHALGNSINGFDWRARKWTRKIAAATGRSDIEQLTLIPFARVLSGMLLFKPHRAWCPLCYDEDRKSGVICEHLAWAIKLVTICPRHHTPLRDTCQGCKQRQPALAVFSRAGHCSYCGQWLGADVTEGHRDYAAGCSKPSEYELYASAAVGALLAIGGTAGRLSLARFRRNLLICTVRLAEGNAKVLSELTGISKSAIQSWITTRMRPRLDVLIRMCSYLGVSIATMLTARRLAEVDWKALEAHCPRLDRGLKRHQSSNEVRCEIEAALRSQSPCSIRELTQKLGFQRPERLYQVDGALCHRITVRYRNCTRTHWWRLPGAKRISDLTTIQGLLEKSLAMNPPIPVRQIAGDLGYANGGFIHRNFPELCHAIAAKTATYKAKELATIRCALLGACAEQPPPTLRDLNERLGFRSSSAVQVRFPELANRLVSARLEYKRKQDSQNLRTELLFIIYGNNAPALSSVSRRLNVSRSSLVDRWPDLCRAISARYLQYRRETKIQRLASLNEDARRIAKELHKQGLRPTHKRIRERLPGGSIKDWAVLHGAVKRAQQFLGLGRR
jgi:transcriptional regulator with XRE-family HTH domain